MRIHFVHPKFLCEPLLQEEHDFLHRLFDALSGIGKEKMDHPDLFRYQGRKGQLYIRHRKLAEEMGIRGMPHETVLDRRDIEAEEWNDLQIDPQEVFSDASDVRSGPPGRISLPESGDPEDLMRSGETCSAIPGKVDLEILRGLWRIYRHVVMERSYARYRALIDPVQGQGRGSVWMLFDMMMEEAFALVPEEKGPGIAYETIWEFLGEEASEAEKAEYRRLTEALEPGKISLEMRRFLAAVANRQGNRDLTVSALLKPYLE